MRSLLVATAALAAGGLTATALAVPPGGPIESPLGATVTLAQTTVPATGVVTASAIGYDPAEHVSLKVDDGAIKDTHNNDVLGTVDAAPDGTFTTTVDLARIAPPLGAGTHNVRLLSSAAAGARSIHVDFTVPGAATPAPTTPAPTTPTTTTEAPAVAVAPSIASTALRAAGGQVAVRLRGGSAGLAATVGLRTRAGAIAVARAAQVTLAPSATRTFRLALTRAGRAQLRRHPRLAVTLKVTSPGKAIKKSLTLKAAA